MLQTSKRLSAAQISELEKSLASKTTITKTPISTAVKKPAFKDNLSTVSTTKPAVKMSSPIVTDTIRSTAGTGTPKGEKIPVDTGGSDAPEKEKSKTWIYVLVIIVILIIIIAYVMYRRKKAKKNG